MKKYFIGADLAYGNDWQNITVFAKDENDTWYEKLDDIAAEEEKQEKNKLLTCYPKEELVDMPFCYLRYTLLDGTRIYSIQGIRGIFKSDNAEENPDQLAIDAGDRRVVKLMVITGKMLDSLLRDVYNEDSLPFLNQYHPRDVQNRKYKQRK